MPDHRVGQAEDDRPCRSEFAEIGLGLRFGHPIMTWTRIRADSR
jgi:hypothetical protein